MKKVESSFLLSVRLLLYSLSLYLHSLTTILLETTEKSAFHSILLSKCVVILL